MKKGIRRLRYIYRCTTEGPKNNGLMTSCNFQMEFDEGVHHCPQCGHPLQLVTSGKSVAEILRQGLEAEVKGTQ